MRQSDPQVPAESGGYEMVVVRIGDAMITAEVPVTDRLSERGLGGRTKLEDGRGMLWRFDPPQRPTFWMKGMQFALDFIWMKDGIVTEIMADVPPPGTTVAPLPLYTPTADVDGVLEVSAGYAAKQGITVGAPVTIVPGRARS